MLSATPLPGALPKWPKAPFHDDPYENTIYVNQFGAALIKGKVIKTPGQIDNYTLFFDDGGSSMTVQSTGRLRTQMAYYRGPGRPTLVASYNTTMHGERFIAPDPPDRQMHYIAIRAADGQSTGVYSLRVRGPAAGYVEHLKIDPRNDAGASGSDISGDGDCDFYRFTTTKPGNWTVFVRPDSKQLDAEFTVFDAKGNPVGGAFTSAINDGGNGATEGWTGPNLPAYATYFVRVDGHADSLGGYGVAVMKTDTPVLSVAATPRKPGGRAGAFTITRAGSTIPLVPLRVSYTISGTARNGIDYARLTGTAFFSATGYSTTIFLKPHSGIAAGKSVVLTLRPDPYYTLGKPIRAVMTL